MRYVAIIFGAEAAARVCDDEWRELIDEYVGFNTEARSAGVLVGGEALRPADTATVVRSMDRGTVITDGPFGDQADRAIGFYMLECENLDQAIQWAAKMPHARTGAVEVRPAVDMDGRIER